MPGDHQGRGLLRTRPGSDSLYLEGTTINKVATASDGSIWAVGSFEDEGGGLYRISPR